MNFFIGFITNGPYLTIGSLIGAPPIMRISDGLIGAIDVLILILLPSLSKNFECSFLQIVDLFQKELPTRYISKEMVSLGILG